LQKTQTIRFKDAYASDVHLGTRRSPMVQMFSDLLERTQATSWTFVGDTIDGHDITKFGHYWPKPHQVALARLVNLPRDGTSVTIIPGNHDAGLRRSLKGAGVMPGDTQDVATLMPSGAMAGNISLDRLLQFKQRAEHMVDGRKTLVIHGDEGELPHSSFWAKRYDEFYYGLNHLSPRVQKAGQPFKRPTQIFQRFADGPLGFGFLGSFRDRVSAEAKQAGAEGVITGHIHYPEQLVNGVHYANCGSMQADMTALVVGRDNKLQIMDWGSVWLAGQGSRGWAYALDEAAERYGAERVHESPRPEVFDKNTQQQARALVSHAVHGRFKPA
jgi:UDP-2,3-diacylglucosamine pyrophosphatase LpxH